MGKSYNFSEYEIKDMVEMYMNKLDSICNIAKKYNVGASAIKDRLIKNGVSIANGSAYSITYWNQRGLSDNEAKEHIKTLRPVNKEYWVKLGYSEEEAILQIEGQKLVSLNGCIARFGDKDGKRIWNERETKRSEAGKLGSANLDFWINKGHSEEEAIKLRSERQKTFSKEICIQKHGKEEGLRIFTDRQNKWQKTLYKNGNLKSGYSEISQQLFYELISEKDINQLNYILFAKMGGEFVLSDINGFYRYDFTDLKNKKIIEYNGDDYHGNPNKYNANDFPNPFRKTITAQEIWDKDELKKKLAEKNGYKLLVIWDSEYKTNKQEIINKCKKFLNK